MKTAFTSILLVTSLAPLAANEKPENPLPKPAKSVSLVIETISLQLSDAAALIRRNPSDAELYETCVGRIGENDAKQESLTVLRSIDGGMATTEAVLETIYPTEFEPPEMPNSVSVGATAKEEVSPVSASDFDAWVSPATPTSFETRNLGITIQVATAIDEKTGLISTQFAPEWVRLAGRTTHGQGVSETPMPEIERQQLTTGFSLHPGKPFLVGTFNRTPEAKVAPEEAERVWFAFVTARVVEP